MTPDQARNVIEEQFRLYKATLSNDRRQLLDKFTIIDMARKVVGVGSVGTRAFMVLLQGHDNADPCSSKSRRPPRRSSRTICPRAATTLPASACGRSAIDASRLRHLPRLDQGSPSRPVFYWRQLRDMKASALVELMSPFAMTFYARMCGWTLARAHARSGDPIAIAEYLGTDGAFDNAIADFSSR